MEREEWLIRAVGGASEWLGLKSLRSQSRWSGQEEQGGVSWYGERGKKLKRADEMKRRSMNLHRDVGFRGARLWRVFLNK